MADLVTFNAELRDRAGKGAARAIRRAGRIPAVIYGEKQPPIMVVLEPKSFEKERIQGGFFTRLFDIAVADGVHRVLARDVQLDPVTDRPLHVDFLRVSADSMLHVAVPVHFINHELSPGLKKGGMLSIVRHEVELVCPATAIPDHLVVDMASYDIGDSIHISMIALPEGSRPAIGDRDFTVATLAPPTVAPAADQE